MRRPTRADIPRLLREAVTTRYLNYADAAAYLALPVGTLRAMVHRKTIPHYRIGPRTVTFAVADLEQWLERQRVAS